MRVITVPFRLRVVVTGLLAALPLAIIETIIAARAPWWKLPYKSISIWSAVAFLVFFPLGIWMLRGQHWALKLTRSFAILWCVASVWIAIRMRNPNLGFFALGLTLYWIAQLAALRRELSRSFFDPRIRWFQGLPKPIPGLGCQVLWGDRKADLSVCRLDQEGAFVFSGNPALKRDESARGELPELVFTFREKQIRCSGMLIRAMEEKWAAGFQFRGLTPDKRKQLGDFVESLRGEGYVY